MKRRDLIKGAAALPLLAHTMLADTAAQRPIIKPKRLSPGDTVGIIAPSSGITPESWESAIANIEGLGFRVKVAPNARGRLSFLSGTDKQRLEDLHWAFQAKEVKATWCVRGGGGAPRLLPDIDYALIRRNPKAFIGISDATALHIAIHQMTGLVTFHGPAAVSQFSDLTRKHVLAMLTTPEAPYVIEQGPGSTRETITAGKAVGTLTGGNLALITALAGTRHAIESLKGKIVFIEDVNEPPYRVDRMLTQLRQSTDIDKAAGVALGIFETSTEVPRRTDPELLDVFRDRLGTLGMPVACGLQFGHIRDNVTIPYGIRCELDAAAGKLTFLEPAVS